MDAHEVFTRDLNELDEYLLDGYKRIQTGKDPAKDSAFSRSYNAFSGIDVKVRFVYADGSSHYISSIQAIGWNTTKPSPHYLELMLVMFDEDEVRSKAEEHGGINCVKEVVLESANEYGAVAHCIITIGRYVGEKYQVSIDDLVTEIIHVFELIRVKGWKKGESSYKTQEREEFIRLAKVEIKRN